MVVVEDVDLEREACNVCVKVLGTRIVDVGALRSLVRL
jgi:hypothetical protein